MWVLIIKIHNIFYAKYICTLLSRYICAYTLCIQLFVGKQENESLSPYLESNVCSYNMSAMAVRKSVLFNLLHSFFLFCLFTYFVYFVPWRYHDEKYINFGKWRRKIPMPLIPSNWNYVCHWISHLFFFCKVSRWLLSCCKIFQKIFLTRSMCVCVFVVWVCEKKWESNEHTERWALLCVLDDLEM